MTLLPGNIPVFGIRLVAVRLAAKVSISVHSTFGSSKHPHCFLITLTKIKKHCFFTNIDTLTNAYFSSFN